MANPYAGKAKSTSAAKAKAISGKPSKGHVFDGSPMMKARGGSVGKGKTNININIMSKPEKEPMPVPVPVPAGGPPPMGPKMPGPMTGEPPLGPPPGPPPMMRKAGGRVKMTAGADTGEGRIQKTKLYKRG